MSSSKSSTGFIDIYDICVSAGETTREMQSKPRKHLFKAKVRANFKVSRPTDDLGFPTVSYANYRLYGSMSDAIKYTAVSPDGLCRSFRISTLFASLMSMKYNRAPRQIKRLGGPPPKTVGEMEAQAHQAQNKKIVIPSAPITVKRQQIQKRKGDEIEQDVGSDPKRRVEVHHPMHD